MSEKTLHANKNKQALEELAQMNGAKVNAPIIVDDQHIEPVLAAEGLSKVAEQEAFMNEIVEVLIAETTDEDQPNHVVVNVNGLNQPIFRGVVTPVRRSMVEVLARCKETKYTQIQDKYELDRSELRARTANAYPFQMFDRNPKGAPWLKAILAEAA